VAPSAEKSTIGLYTQDHLQYIHRYFPLLFTKADKKGRFRIDNIKPGTYKIYAFDDKNKTLGSTVAAERFGYLTDTVDLRTKSIYDTIRLGLSCSIPAPSK